MTKICSHKTLRFTSTIMVPVTRYEVWQLLMNVNAMVEILPDVESCRVIEPRRKFLVTMGYDWAGQHASAVMPVEWTNVQIPSTLETRSLVTWCRQEVVILNKWVAEEEEGAGCVLEFSAEIRLPPAIPAPLVHTMYRKFVETLLTNLLNHFAPPDPCIKNVSLIAGAQLAPEPTPN